jgi:hypothetical protein
MDALDQLILAERRLLDELRIQVAAQEAKVAALVEAASLRPNFTASKKGPTGRTGKPKGAISANWKNTLRELYATGKAWPYADIKACFDHVNTADLAIASVRDRVRALADAGLMEGDADAGFKVTEAAARKFKFPKLEEAPDANASETSSSEGPVGRERGFPPTAPEGSTPSGSTFSNLVYRGQTDPDDDIPF